LKLDNETDFLEQEETVMKNEMNWNRVLTKRKKPTKKKVCCIENFLFAHFYLGEKRTSSGSTN
jgi:hypothetical protein